MSNIVDKSLATLAVIGIAAGIGGVGTGFYAVNAIDKWEARYYTENEKYETLKKNCSKESKITIAAITPEYANFSLSRQNRNPMNIKTQTNGKYWEGQIGEDKFHHAIFKHESYSYRAALILFKTYEQKHHVNTVTEFVNRYCTGNRNEYIKYLCNAIGVKPDQKISLTERACALLPAVAQFETGEKIDMHYVELIKAAKL